MSKAPTPSRTQQPKSILLRKHSNANMSKPYSHQDQIPSRMIWKHHIKAHPTRECNRSMLSPGGGHGSHNRPTQPASACASSAFGKSFPAEGRIISPSVTNSLDFNADFSDRFMQRFRDHENSTIGSCHVIPPFLRAPH